MVNEIYLSLQGESTFAGLPCVFVRLTACNLRCSYCDTAYAFTEGRRRPLDEVLEEVRRLAEPYDETGSKFEVQRSTLNVQRPTPTAQRPTSNGQRSMLNVERSTSEVSPESQISDLRSGIPKGPRWPLVELTGGEPLLQPTALVLMRQLADEGFTVLLETSGALDISAVDPRVHRIMDLKCPSSGETGRNRWENLPHLRVTDEVKFVIGTAEDYAWAKETVATHRLDEVCPVLFSWVAPLTPAQQHPALKPLPAEHTPLTRRELAERIIADALPVRFQVQMHKVIWPSDQRAV